MSICFLYTNSGAIPYTNAFFGPTRGSLLIDNVQCRGSEDNILNCSRNPIGVLHSYCDHNDDVGIQCPGKYKSAKGLTDVSKVCNEEYINEY